MHVLIIPSWYPSAPGDINGSFFREQALALHRRGCEVSVIYPQLSSLRSWRGLSGGKRGVVRETDEGMPVLRLHGTNTFPLLHSAACRWWVHHGLTLYARHVDEFGRPDLVHAHSALYGGALARELWQREGLPYVLTEHSSMYSRGRVSRAQIRIARRVAEDARRKFAVSEAFAHFLDGYFGGRAAGWDAMPNIVDNAFAERPMQAPADDGYFAFISIGVLTENKGIHHLLAAFARVREANPDVVLRIGGDGPERQRLERLADTLGITGSVEFLGALTREKVAEQVSRAQVLVHPSQYETFGVAIIEALALGKPVIATRCGGPDAIVTPHDGMLVPVGDEQVLTEAMWTMRERIGDYDAAGIRRACLARFGERAVVERLTQVYAGVIAESANGRAAMALPGGARS